MYGSSKAILSIHRYSWKGLTIATLYFLVFFCSASGIGSTGLSCFRCVSSSCTTHSWHRHILTAHTHHMLTVSFSLLRQPAASKHICTRSNSPRFSILAARPPRCLHMDFSSCHHSVPIRTVTSNGSHALGGDTERED